MQKKLRLKQFLTLPLFALTTSIFAHDSIFEQPNHTSSPIGSINVSQPTTPSLKKNIKLNATFDTSEVKQLLVNLKKVKKHLLGKTTLSTDDLETLGSAIVNDNKLFTDNYDVINRGLEVIDLYESKYGGLFTKGTKSQGGFDRKASGYELENLMLVIMQSVIDHSYTEANLKAYPQLFNNRLFKTSSYFPGVGYTSS